MVLRLKKWFKDRTSSSCDQSSLFAWRSILDLQVNNEDSDQSWRNETISTQWAQIKGSDVIGLMFSLFGVFAVCYFPQALAGSWYSIFLTLINSDTFPGEDSPQKEASRLELPHVWYGFRPYETHLLFAFIARSLHLVVVSSIFWELRIFSLIRPSFTNIVLCQFDFVWFDSLRPLNNLSVMRDGSSCVEPVLS